MTRVKICGITQVEDAAAAVELGADALGFVFTSSPRQITPETARSITDNLPPYVVRTGVFVGDDPRIPEIVDFCGLDVIQLHSGYSAGFAERLQPRRIVLGVRMKDESSLSDIPGLRWATAVLLDAFSPDAAGGTGKTFDWALAQKASHLGKPVILSGGLTPGNVQEAILRVRPYAVDVSSGVERSPGIKDREKMREFIERARSAET